MSGGPLGFMRLIRVGILHGRRWNPASSSGRGEEGKMRTGMGVGVKGGVGCVGGEQGSGQGVGGEHYKKITI